MKIRTGLIPMPPDIAATPELAILAALDAVLELSCYALLAANPELDGDNPAPTPQATAADRVFHHAHRLQRAVGRYRDLAVKASTPPPNFDAPF